MNGMAFQAVRGINYFVENKNKKGMKIHSIRPGEEVPAIIVKRYRLVSRKSVKLVAV